MWDSLLYAVNMFYYHWLIKKLIWPIAGQNITKQGWERTKLKARRKKAESGRCHFAAKGERCQNITSKPQPCGDTKINRNMLI